MKTRNTLVLLVLVSLFLAYLKWWDTKFEGTDAKNEKKGRPVQIDRDSVTAVTVRNSEGSLQLRKADDGTWLLDAPVKDRVDTLAISTLFTALESLHMDVVSPSKDGGLEKFGLTKGEVSIRVNGKNPVELLIGKKTPIGEKVYMRIEGKDTAYVAPKNLYEQAVKGLREWRERRLSDLTMAQVSRVTLKTAKGEVEVEKVYNHWSLVRPFKGRADDQKVMDLISNTTAPRIEEFVADTRDLGALGLNEPRATVTFHAEGVKDPVVLQIGGEKKTEKPEEKKPGDASPLGTPPSPPAPALVYVKLSSREGVFTVPAAIASVLDTQPSDLRDQAIMRVQTEMVDRITLEAPGRAKIILGRKGEEWVRKEGKGDIPVNGGAANRLLADLTMTRIVRPVADVADDLKKYGLDVPVATVTLSSYSTEGTPESKPGDRPLAKLMFGKFEGEAGYAKLDDEPFIVAVPQMLLDEVWTDPLQWQELKIQELKSEEVAGFEITRAGQPALAFVRGEDKMWKLAKGDGAVSQGAANSLVNTLANLHAVRWAGATAATQGFDKPNVLITFTLADKKTGRLAIGSNTAEELWHATLDGKTGTFLLSKPDFDALNASLIETPKSAAAPNAPATTVTTEPVAVPPPPPRAKPQPPIGAQQ